MIKHTMFMLVATLSLSGCTQESQNQLGRSVRNWTGDNGVLEIYAGDKLVRRFLDVDKLTTALGTDSGEARPYRFGYGYFDTNLNGTHEADEGGKVYFEISDYSTPYVFYENPGK